MRHRNAAVLAVLVAVCAIAPAVADEDTPVLTDPLPAPVFAPFGERAVAAIGAKGSGAIIVVELSGEPKTRVVSRRGVDPRGAAPRWSADGSRVAWTVGSAAMIAGVAKDGHDKRTLGKAISDFDPTSDWAVVDHGTYSGERVAFAITKGKAAGTFVAPAFGGATVRVSDAAARAIAWSEDGQRVALALDDRLVVVGHAGGEEIEVASLPPAVDGPVAVRFAGDDRLLVFAGGQVRSHPVDGGDATSFGGKARLDAVAAAWSPTEELLAVVTSEAKLVVIDAKGAMDVTDRGRERVISAPAWAPDGTHVAVIEWGGPGEVAFTSYELEKGETQRVPLFWNPTKRSSG